jgi:small subunit ribosomal protein S7
LKERKNRGLRYKQALAKLKGFEPKGILTQPPKQEYEGKAQNKGDKKKKKHRKWKPKPLIDNFGRPVYVPQSLRRRVKMSSNFANWLERRQRKILHYARLDIRFSGRWRRFRYDPNFKPKRYYKKPQKSSKLEPFIEEKDWDSVERKEPYIGYVKRYLEQKTNIQSEKSGRILRRLRRESRMLKTFLGALVRRGKKSKAVKIFRSLIRLISLSKFYKRRKKGKGKQQSPMRFIFRAVVLASPRIMLKSKRVGGVIYRLPIFIEGSRRARSFGMRWIVASAQRRPEKLMAERLASEIIDIHRGKGLTMKRKAEMYKIGVGNKAFVHYMWRKKKKRKKALKKINRR